jgi:hypothetical protein
VWTGNPSSYVAPPGEPSDAAAAAAAGRLDFDSNAQCIIDGRREENVVWTMTGLPASGAYAVLVDAFSLCAATTAHWKVDVFAEGMAMQHAEGTVTDADTRGAHVAGSGTRALQFALPPTGVPNSITRRNQP